MYSCIYPSLIFTQVVLFVHVMTGHLPSIPGKKTCFDIKVKSTKIKTASCDFVFEVVKPQLLYLKFRRCLFNFGNGSMDRNWDPMRLGEGGGICVGMKAEWGGGRRGRGDNYAWCYTVTDSLLPSRLAVLLLYVALTERSFKLGSAFWWSTKLVAALFSSYMAGVLLLPAWHHARNAFHDLGWV